jgi:hypothetical protein
MPTGPMEYIEWRRRRESIGRFKDEFEAYKWFVNTQIFSPFQDAGAECPFYIVCPPSLRPRDKWIELLKHLPIPATILETLLANGFMPLDFDLLSQMARLDHWENTFGIPARNTLADCDYGIVSTAHANRLGNANMDSGMVDRYARRAPFLNDTPQAIFSLGAIRGMVLLGETRTTVFPAIPTRMVATRAELDEIISDVSANAANANLMVWYRGQPAEYLLADFTSVEYEPFIPWRSVRDPSLVPSLYRQAWNGLGSLPDYCTLLSDLEIYSLAASNNLGFLDSTQGAWLEEPTRILPGHFEELGLSTMLLDSEGNEEVNDSRPGFGGLQRSFFFQHYGLPSPVLDITHSLDVALFFAQNRVREGRMVPIGSDDHPVLYLLALDPTIDRCLYSAQLLRDHKLLRPIRQSCGLMAGASLITKNFYSRYISIRIELTAPVAYDQILTPQYLFPNRADDGMLDLLMTIADQHSISIRPFELNS